MSKTNQSDWQNDKTSGWLCHSLSQKVKDRIERMAVSDDVVRIAVMPDVHLAAEYCVGTVVATKTRIYPQAVGGDIGCGMAAMRIDASADLMATGHAEQLLKMLNRFVPSNRHSRETAAERLPTQLMDWELSDGKLEKMKLRDGRVQLGTLGRGNHFLEFQSDEEGALWLMLHSGSRGMGQAIANWHLRSAIRDDALPYLVDSSREGQAYVNDLNWALEYARQNRLAMLQMTGEIVQAAFGISMDENTLIESDHNHLRRELHDGVNLWVHRKGAQSAADGEPGVIPGSMGSSSYHVVGRGCSAALNSSSHGAGRQYSRTAARQRNSAKEVRRQMSGVFFDPAKTEAIRDEVPAAYKDIRKVMKSQRELVKTVRVLQPLLSYKGV